MTEPRALTETERALVARARRKAFVLYEGRITPHRSCGIALAETFGLPPAPYQSLRRGGITGNGECGAIVAGRLVLGQLLGDPDPLGGVTPALRAAMLEYEALVPQRVDRGAAPGVSIVCNTLTSPFAQFLSPQRLGFCTNLAATVAELVAETALRHGGAIAIGAIPGEEEPT